MKQHIVTFQLTFCSNITNIRHEIRGMREEKKPRLIFRETVADYSIDSTKLNLGAQKGRVPEVKQ